MVKLVKYKTQSHEHVMQSNEWEIVMSSVSLVPMMGYE